MNLGALIERLEAAAPNAHVVIDGTSIPVEFTSYRGYYDQLAIDYESGAEPMTVTRLLAAAKAAVGATFHGYKGGDYRMSEYTPVWVSRYGATESRAIVGLDATKTVVRILTANIEDYA